MFFILMLLLAGCSTTPVVPTDSVVEEQKKVIVEQRETIANAKIESEAIAEKLKNAQDALEEAMKNNNDLGKLFMAIDDFVREVIESEERLRRNAVAE